VDDPTVQMWIDFTLTSVERGRQAVQTLGGSAAFAGRSVLDVGCAYGGFLVAAAEAGAKRVVGIDIDQGLLDLARLQLADHHTRAEVRQLDITSDGAADALGQFDIVLCNDVIEHVADPARCAANLAAVLRPGGRVFLEIPNGSAADFMHRDGHYGLFGITLLGREPAERWWRLHFNDRYGVEHYAPLSYYLQIFSAVGISLRQLSRVANLEDRVEEVADSFDRLEMALAGLERPETPDLVEAIRLRGAEEINRFRQLRHRYQQSQIPAERAILAEEIVTTYGTTFWTLEGFKLS
jgi:SAM-dependent methyltransferase